MKPLISISVLAHKNVRHNYKTVFIVTRRMAIANGTCVSFCNQPKAHYLSTSRKSRRYVVAGAIIWLRQESLRHILASSWNPKVQKFAILALFFTHFDLRSVRPWDNRDKFYMDGKRIQCLSNASQHVPIYLQPFPSNSSRKFNSTPF